MANGDVAIDCFTGLLSLFSIKSLSLEACNGEWRRGHFLPQRLSNQTLQLARVPGRAKFGLATTRDPHSEAPCFAFQ